MPKLPEQVLKAVRMLNNRGFEAWVVGGFVRDTLMGRTGGDIDVTTNGLPEQVRNVFTQYKVIETGLKHGTLTVVIDHMHIEITTYRTETGYTDNRHPDNVTFTRSLEEDCARRDFTINAICYNPTEGYRDYYGGMADIENKVIRCVGNPCERFNEDALRILRRIRFASQLGFAIEENTKQAIFDCRHLLENISAERIYTELLKLLCGVDVKRILLDYTEILAVFMPQIMALKGFLQHNHHHIYDVLEHTAVAVENTPPNPQLRLAALLHDFGKPATFTMDEKGVGHFYGHGEASFEISKAVLKKLKVSNEEYSLITHLVKYHDVYIPAKEKAVRRALNKHGENRLRLLLQLKRADNKGQNTKDFDRTGEYDRLEKIINEQIEKQRCFSLKQLAVNGKDLIDIGIPPSKKTGEVLNALLEAVLNGEIENNKELLLDKAKNFI